MTRWEFWALFAVAITIGGLLIANLVIFHL